MVYKNRRVCDGVGRWAGSLLQNPPSCFCLMAQHPLQLKFTAFFFFFLNDTQHHSPGRSHKPATGTFSCHCPCHLFHTQHADRTGPWLAAHLCKNTQQMHWFLKLMNTSTVLLKIYSEELSKIRNPGRKHCRKNPTVV